MAIDINKIKARLAQLEGTNKDSTSSGGVQYWKPTPGEHKVRGVPWPMESLKDGMPLREIWWYYLGDSKGELSLKQFNEPDPINQFISKLYDSGKPEERELAKSMKAKMRAYMAVIVRGEEDKGVQLWSFGKPMYTRILSFYGDEDLSGHDIKIKVVHMPGKTFKNKPSYDLTADPVYKQTKLSEDPALVKKWIESVPNLDELYKKKSYKELETVLTNWLNAGAEVSKEPGTTRGPDVKDELDVLKDELKSDSPPAVATKEEKPVVSAKKKDKKTDLDKAFEDL
jgi:hypothetical protein